MAEGPLIFDNHNSLIHPASQIYFTPIHGPFVPQTLKPTGLEAASYPHAKPLRTLRSKILSPTT